MCDYSLATFPNRLAIEGERLLSYRFPSYSIGLASPADIKAATSALREAGVRRSWWSRLKTWAFRPEPRSREVTAVCIPPGARLRVSNISEKVQQKLGIGPAGDVVFAELSASGYQYRDAIWFNNGRKVLLQALGEGIRFEVLSLGMMEPELELPQDRTKDFAPASR